MRLTLSLFRESTTVEMQYSSRLSTNEVKYLELFPISKPELDLVVF